MFLAELNVGRFLYPIDDPRMAEFKDNLDRINALAERSAGFVWRLKDDSNNATAFRIGENEAVNLSVWETPAALEHFVFKTVHVHFYKKREAWFVKPEGAHMVFWWVKEDHRPDLAEAAERLEAYRAQGATDFAFGWADIMDVGRMKTLRCG